MIRDGDLLRNYPGYLLLTEEVFRRNPMVNNFGAYLNFKNFRRLEEIKWHPQMWPELANALDAALANLATEDDPIKNLLAQRRATALTLRFRLLEPDAPANAPLTPYLEVGSNLQKHGARGEPLEGQMGISFTPTKIIIRKGILALRRNSFIDPIYGLRYPMTDR